MTSPEPTGLDYQAAYEVMYPGLMSGGTKIHELNDHALRTVQRAARLRRAERERVKAEFLALAVQWESMCSTGDAVDLCADEIRKTAEEIR